MGRKTVRFRAEAARWGAAGGAGPVRRVSVRGPGRVPAGAMSMSHLYGTDGEDGVEMENFEVSDWDLQNEFNPHRQRHRQSKEEATYGVWAERDSDEERPSFGGKRYGPGAGGRRPWRPQLCPARGVGRARVTAPFCGRFQAVTANPNSPARDRGGRGV